MLSGGHHKYALINKSFVHTCQHKNVDKASKQYRVRMN